MRKSKFRKGLVLAVIVLFVGASVVPSTGMEEKSTMGRGILYVGGSGPGNYTAIQDAIDNASNGDTVYVYNGTYYENVVVDKTISLIGENRNTTIIDGGGSDDVVYVSADWVNISGFTVQNSGSAGYPQYHSGIQIVSNFTNVSNNTIVDNNRGIWCRSDNNSILDNYIVSNTNQGLELYLCNHNLIQGNNLSYGTYGVKSDGDSQFNSILENNIFGNSIIGIYFDASSSNNLIYHNNLINNTQNAYDECSNTWDNGYPSGGNYWDDYTGNDTNGDDIGDTPYNITGGDNQDLYPFMHPNGWINHPPYAPSDPIPEDGEHDVPIANLTLLWSGGDPDVGDVLQYDVYFGDTPNPPLFIGILGVPYNQTPIEFELYKHYELEYNTTYFWKIKAWDNHGETTEGPIWNFITAKAPEPDLYCEGSLSWTSIAPGSTISDFFTIENIGEPVSLLDWEIAEYPDWGDWTFIPSSGVGLTPEDGEYTVGVTVTAPDEQNTEFTGTIRIVNMENSSDFCTIDVTLATPKNKLFNFFNSLLSWLFERFPWAFPIIRQLIGFD